MHLLRFTVTGGGEFPLDMLRYEGAYPETQQDARRAQYEDERREVTVLKWSDRPDWYPTSSRWESFGWRVKPGSVEPAR